MCGRVTLEFDIDTIKEILKEVYHVKDSNLHDFKPSYNIGPTNQLVSIISDGMTLRGGTLRWGLLPSWTKDEKTGYKMINARSETIEEKPSFKDAYEKRRCIILASGFYEWDKKHHTKQPYYFTMKNKPLMAMAGIWSTYNRDGNEKIHTCAIVTTSANEQMAMIHGRMPVLLEKEQINDWLTGQPTIRRNLMVPYNDKMNMIPVSQIVNSVYNDDPMCIEHI